MSVILAVGLALFIFLSGLVIASYVEEHLGFYSGFMLLICYIIFGLSMLIGVSAITYKEGQIDALTGDVKYELVEKEDMTKEWVRIKGEK